MASELVADFLATVDAPPLSKPRPARVLMRSDQLVCVTEDHRIVIPLVSISDVSVGQVPDGMQEYFDDGVAIAYDEGNIRSQVLLEARAQSMETFRIILFKTLLGGRPVQVRYPANRGGHVLDTGYTPGRIALKRGELIIKRSDGDLHILLDAVTSYTRGRATVHGEKQWMIEVGFLEEGTIVAARIAPGDERILTILGKFLKLEYSRIHHEIARLDFEEPLLRALVALDAGVNDFSDSMTAEGDSEALLSKLQEYQLITSNGQGHELTRRGRIAAKTHLESVNG